MCVCVCVCVCIIGSALLLAADWSNYLCTGLCQRTNIAF